ncbi:LysR family transcriptional regulator, partial [Escherichia coli]
MNYSLKQLKVFVTVEQEKRFMCAGERIGLSQSAVSYRGKERENHTG